MSDDELEIFLKNNPVEFDNGFIRHSYHRACAMIGRLINGKKYIPFYMHKDRINNRISAVKYLDMIFQLIVQWREEPVLKKACNPYWRE